MPPPGSPIAPGATSGEFATAGQNPVSRALRMLKTQLTLAVGLREEDPERAWLEVVSVREKAESLAEGAANDALLKADVERFRFKLDEQLRKLTRDVGDELIAPLYSWVDLVRQRARLDTQVATAQSRVAEARASRGAPGATALATEEQASAALEAAEKDIAWWQADPPPDPPAEALALWNEHGGDALRRALPTDANAVRSRGLAARAVVEAAQGRALGESKYVGSIAEFIVLPAIGAAALLSSMLAFARSGPHALLSVAAVVACGSFGAAIAASIQARRRVVTERRAAVDLVWHHTMHTEQVRALDIEGGWLRALSASLRARRAFDAHKGEGGQLAELAKWRPDLEEVVSEVAKSSVAPPSPT